MIPQGSCYCDRICYQERDCCLDIEKIGCLRELKEVLENSYLILSGSGFNPPDNVTASANSSTTILITWDIVPTGNQNGIIPMYEVLYRPLEIFNGAIMTETTNVSESMMSVVLSNLEEFVNYTISLRAYTSEGAGPYSEEVTVMTPEDSKSDIYFAIIILLFCPSPVPANPPDNVTASANSSTTIIVTWDIVPPIHQNGIITMYEVLYQPRETFNGAITTQTMNVSGSMMSVVLSNLEEFVNYTIFVRAYTSEGAGPYGEEVTVMTPEDSKSNI